MLSCVPDTNGGKNYGLWKFNLKNMGYHLEK